MPEIKITLNDLMDQYALNDPVDQHALELSTDQENAIDKLISWFQAGEKPHITLGGYAGTGKTTVIGLFASKLKAAGINPSIHYMSFTGKATLQIKRRMRSSISPADISTIHSAIYKAILDSSGRIKDWVLNDEIDSDPNLIVIDESSMIPKNIFDDLGSFEIPLIFVGDHGQLEPIRSDGFNLMKDPEIKLETIHRNAGGISTVAEQIRRGSFLNYGQLADNVEKVVPQSWPANRDILDIVYNPSPDKMTIVATNNFRTEMNTAVVKYLRPYLDRDSTDRPKIPVRGDRVICLRNNRRSGIFNGLIGEVISDVKDVSKHHISFSFRSDCDERVIKLDKVSKYFFLNPYGKEPKDMSYKLIGDRFDYAYAITCHKAQGSEASKVAVFGQGFNDTKRWLYTAATRAIDQLYLAH